jgi:hypothetical protein
MHVYSFCYYFAFLFIPWIYPFLFPFEHTRQMDPPNWPATKDPPNWPAALDLPNWPAIPDLPNWPARLALHFGPANAPLTRNSPAGHDRQQFPPPPPPTTPTPTRQKGGWGAGGPGLPEHPKQVLYFTAPFTNGLHMHVLHTYSTFLFLIQSGRIILKSIAKYITFRRRKLLQGRGVRSQSSHSKGGILLIVYNNRKSAGNPGLTRMEMTQSYIISTIY